MPNLCLLRHAYIHGYWFSLLLRPRVFPSFDASRFVRVVLTIVITITHVAFGYTVVVGATEIRTSTGTAFLSPATYLIRTVATVIIFITDLGAENTSTIRATELDTRT